MNRPLLEIQWRMLEKCCAELTSGQGWIRPFAARGVSGRPLTGCCAPADDEDEGTDYAAVRARLEALIGGD